MPESELEKIADNAKVIANGYAFSEREDGFISDKHLTEKDSAKFFVKADGTSVMKRRGDLTDSEISTIEKFIKANYLDMYNTWKDFGGGDFFGSEGK